MIQTKLITGGHQSERLNLAQGMIKKHLGRLQHPDLLIIEGVSSIAISQVRELKKRLARKPYSASIKITLIPEAEKITFPAQNALLKTLEEPPGKALIILLAPKKEALLPTIISRCEIIQLPEKPAIEIDQERITYHVSRITSILNSGVGERLIIAEEYSQNHQEAIDFCQKQLAVWREILRKDARAAGIAFLGLRSHFGEGGGDARPGVVTRTLRQIHQALIYLEANVNPRLVVENLLLNYPSTKI